MNAKNKIYKIKINGTIVKNVNTINVSNVLLNGVPKNQMNQNVVWIINLTLLKKNKVMMVHVLNVKGMKYKVQDFGTTVQNVTMIFVTIVRKIRQLKA
jgi:hypothetical protein